MQRTIRQTTSSLTASLCIVALLCAASFISLRRSAAEARLVEHTRQVLIAVGQTRSALQDAETGQRGYLLTGNEDYLTPYRRATREIGADLDALKRLTHDNSAQKIRLDRLQTVSDLKLTELKHTVDLYGSHQPAAALKIVRSDLGRQYMEEASALLNAIEAEENQLLQQRSAEAAVAARVTFIVVVGGCALLLLVLLWSVRTIRRDLILRSEVTEALRQSEEWLATTLQSIGDAVLATDAQGRIIMMNPVAEGLTGWRQQEAKGKGCGEVFRIVNEETRATVESPIAKVIKDGVTVGLANHTILIAKDGNEYNIDDSGAPIRDKNGELIGVVLVFRDITERRHSEREILLLNHRLQRAMTETHHRVKNNLQVLAAMIDMQKADAEDTVPISELERLGQNIQALSVIHDLLTQEAKASGQAASISASAVLEKLVDVLRQTVGGRKIRFVTEAALLSGRQATGLALVTNELISNALKHGKGEVEISFTVTSGVATLEVCDDGAGFPTSFDPAVAAHTGLELVENIVRHDLRGKPFYGNRSQGGARVAITFPVSD